MEKKKKDNKERLAIIVSAFPGCGKTTLFENIKKKYGNKVLISYSDSSKFDKSEFPQNYIEWISDNINNYDIILVSSHKEVREELEKKDRRMEFILNYVRRGNNFSFIQKIDSNFDNWIDEIENDESEFIHKHKLEGETFLENDILINNFINSIATK